MRTIAFYWFMLIFLAAVVAIGLPTKIIATTPESNTMYCPSITITPMFSTEVFVRYPNYILGLSIIAVMALIGAFLCTNLASKWYEKMIKGGRFENWIDTQVSKFVKNHEQED